MQDQASKEDAKAFMMRLQAARMGCSLCNAAVRVPPSGDPFSKGPHIGRYWCVDCWTLYWDEHPEHLADDESRTYVREDAKRIRVRRGSRLVYEEGENKVYKTSKGTLVFDFRTSSALALNEYDPARLQILTRALEAIAKMDEKQKVVEPKGAEQVTSA
jgi:hypothetical protein